MAQLFILKFKAQNGSMKYFRLIKVQLLLLRSGLTRKHISAVPVFPARTISTLYGFLHSDADTAKPGKSMMDCWFVVSACLARSIRYTKISLVKCYKCFANQSCTLSGTALIFPYAGLHFKLLAIKIWMNAAFCFTLIHHWLAMAITSWIQNMNIRKCQK